MELAALGEGLLTPEQTLSHIGTWVLFPPLLPLQYTLALAWVGGGVLCFTPWQSQDNCSVLISGIIQDKTVKEGKLVFSAVSWLSFVV